MKKITAILLAAWLLAPPASHARKEKEPESRKGSIGELRERKLDLSPDGPMDKANQRARQIYQQYLDDPNADPKLIAEALRRLADLELDDADTADYTAEVRTASYKKAAAHYRDLLARFPLDSRDERVLYQLARAEEGSGDPDAALDVLGQLVARYPQSTLLAEAQFRRGEILFVKHRYEEAEAAYTAVLRIEAGHPAKGEQGSYAESSLYKQGWSRFKQDQFQTSLDAFFQLLDARLGKVPTAELDATIGAMTRPQREIIDDSLRAMGLACQNLGPPKTVSEQLLQHGDPAYGYLLYDSLAAIYTKQQRYNDVSATLTGFVEAHPLDTRAPGFEIQAVGALESGGFVSQALVLRSDYVKRFSLDQPFWKGRKPADHVATVDYLRDSIWLLAQQRHALAQNKTVKPEDRAADAAEAIEQYRRYARLFPQDPRVPQAQFLLGDLLYDTGELQSSVEAYEAAAYNYPDFDHRSDAGFASLQAYQKRETELVGEAHDAWHRRRLDADLRFAETFADRKEAAQIKANAAAGLYEIGELDKAVLTAESLIKDTRSDNASRLVAWRVIGYARFDQQDFAQAETAYLETQKLAPPGKPDSDIAERLAASIYRQGEQAQAAGKLLDAAGHFSRVAVEAPNTKIRVTADYDAAMATLKADQPTQAIPMLRAFRDRNPGHPLGAEVTRTLAATYEKAGQPYEAAAELQRISDSPGNDPQLQRDALWHSTELLLATSPQSAIRPLSLYVQRYPAPFDNAIEAYQKLIDLAVARSDANDRVQWSHRLMAFEATGGASRTERSRALAAQASLLPAQIARDAYRRVALTLPLKDSLDTKRARLEDALAAYAQAAEYGLAAVLTESTFETAELYHDLAGALKTSQRPPDLDAAALEQYDLLLDEQIFPFEEKAIAIHEGNAKRARDGLYDDWVKKSFTELAVLSPGRYAKTELAEVSVPATERGTRVPRGARKGYEAAVADLQASRYAEAQAGFNTLLKDFPKLPGPVVNLALVYRQQNKPAAEEAALKVATETWPKYAPGHHQTGLWLRKQGRFAEADEAYARAIDLDAKYLAAHYDRGVLNDLFLQRPQQALTEYEQYQKMLPEPDPLVARWIADLQRRANPGAPTVSAVP